MINRETYCKDCDRSIYGKYHDCDVNIENDGKYVMGDEKMLLQNREWRKGRKVSVGKENR